MKVSRIIHDIHYLRYFKLVLYVLVLYYDVLILAILYPGHDMFSSIQTEQVETQLTFVGKKYSFSWT